MLPPTDAAAPPKLRFTRLSGPEGTRALVVAGPVVRIGALPGNDVAFPADEAAGHVAPVHAKVLCDGETCWLYDNEDDFGLSVNGERIARARIQAGDELRFGDGGPRLRFDGIEAAGGAPAAAGPGAGADAGAGAPPCDQPMTAVMTPAALGIVPEAEAPPAEGARRAVERRLDRPSILVGRSPRCDIVLEHPTVSGIHAEIALDGDGKGHVVHDRKSQNGTFVGRERIGSRRLADGDAIHVGPFLLVYQPGSVFIYDERGASQIDAVHVTRQVGSLKLLDDVSLRLRPGELVGLIGPSGAGKSTLLGALNGLKPATAGHVLVNRLDLYENYESLKGGIGFVPQDDIIHLELTPERTLHYVSRLRFPPDASPEDREGRIRAVLDLLELTERQGIPIRRLSGGQRKRVSLGVELLTEPNLVFLDEPTAGLDPALESKMMVLFKELAKQGKTVVVTTHLMENIDLFDKLVVLVRGQLAFYGTPAEARAHFRIPDIRDLYGALGTATPDEWRGRYVESDIYGRRVGAVDELKPRAEEARSGEVRARLLERRVAPARGESLRQLSILARRYLEIVLRDRRNTVLLLLQAPIIGAFVALALDSPSLILFMLALASIWFGTTNAAKELVKELPIYRRERAVNLRLLPYVLSKAAILFGIALIQCFLLLAVVAVFRPLPGSLALVYLALVLTAFCGLFCGLAISSFVDTTDKATGIVPLVLIPQVLFAGIFTPLTGFSGAMGAVMPTRWSYDLLKRICLSTHREPVPPLVSMDEKDEDERELRALDARSRAILAEVDAGAAEVAAARDRAEAVRRDMDAAAESLAADQAAARKAYAAADVELGKVDAEAAKIAAALERQRAATEETRREMADLRKGPDPEALRARVTPAWIERKQKQADAALADYRDVEASVREIDAARARLAAEREALEARGPGAARSERTLRDGHVRLEAEAAALSVVGRNLAAREVELKEHAARIAAIQNELTENLRFKRYVYLLPRDSMALDVGALVLLSLLFAGLTLKLQRSRDRE